MGTPWPYKFGIAALESSPKGLLDLHVGVPWGPFITLKEQAKGGLIVRPTQYLRKIPF